MAISSPGLGSGLDINGIVDQLVAIERRPIQVLETAKARLGTQLSSMGLLQSHMGNLQSSAAQLASTSFWTRNTATSSDPAALGAVARANAAAGSYTVEVQSLAAAQTLVSAPVEAPSDVGAGTLAFTRAGTTVTVEIPAGANTLEAVRDRINDAGAGVRASIVRDGSGARLVFTGTDTGAANAVSVDASGATGQLASLSYPGGMTQKRAAADALLTVNGVDVRSASNTLDDVVEGLTLTLTRTTTAPVTVQVASDTAPLRKGIEAFIANYNALNGFLGSQVRYDDATRTAGPLQGDRTAVGLQATLRNLVFQSSPASATLGRLADLGIALQRDGSLKIESEAKLSAALAQPAELAKAFATPATGLAQRFKSLADGVLGVTGALTTRSDSLRAGIKRNEKDQERLEDRVARTRERLLAQYQALDRKMGTLSGLASYVTQQMTLLGRAYGKDD